MLVAVTQMSALSANVCIGASYCTSSCSYSSSKNVEGSLARPPIFLCGVPTIQNRNAGDRHDHHHHQDALVLAIAISKCSGGGGTVLPPYTGVSETRSPK